jgi:hypothetical protein
MMAGQHLRRGPPTGQARPVAVGTCDADLLRPRARPCVRRAAARAGGEPDRACGRRRGARPQWRPGSARDAGDTQDRSSARRARLARHDTLAVRAGRRGAIGAEYGPLTAPGATSGDAFVATARATAVRDVASRSIERGIGLATIRAVLASVGLREGVGIGIKSIRRHDIADILLAARCRFIRGGVRDRSVEGGRAVWRWPSTVHVHAASRRRQGRTDRPDARDREKAERPHNSILSG